MSTQFEASKAQDKNRHLSWRAEMGLALGLTATVVVGAPILHSSIEAACATTAASSAELDNTTGASLCQTYNEFLGHVGAALRSVMPDITPRKPVFDPMAPTVG